MEKVLLRRETEAKQKGWFYKTESKYQELAMNIKKYMKIDVLESEKYSCAIDAVNSSVWSFMDKMKIQFYEVLKKSDFNIVNFEQNKLIFSLILSITQKKPKLAFFERILRREKIITGIKEKDGVIRLYTKYGKIDFQRVTDVFKDNEEIMYLYNNKSEFLTSHGLAEKFLELSPEYKAVSSVCKKNTCEKFFHTFIIDKDDNVIDLSKNLIMKKMDYYRLQQVRELNVVNYSQYLEQSFKCEKFAVSKQSYNLLRNALCICWHKDMYMKKEDDEVA